MHSSLSTNLGVVLGASVEIPLLTNIIIILGASVLVIFLFQKLKLPTILGYLMTGILAGPHALGLINASQEVEIMAEIGVILLLFIIGMEFSLKSLAVIKKSVFVGGAAQVGLTTVATALVAGWFGFELNAALFLGFVFSLSSTAIVLKLLQERSEVNSPHGKITLAILIFQDTIVVPEEFETSIEIFSRLLHKYLVPQDEVDHFIADVRTDSHEVLPAREINYRRAAQLTVPNLNTSSLRVQNGNREVVGQDDERVGHPFALRRQRAGHSA